MDGDAAAGCDGAEGEIVQCDGVFVWIVAIMWIYDDLVIAGQLHRFNIETINYGRGRACGSEEVRRIVQRDEG